MKKIVVLMGSSVRILPRCGKGGLPQVNKPARRKLTLVYNMEIEQQRWEERNMRNITIFALLVGTLLIFGCGTVEEPAEEPMEKAGEEMGEAMDEGPPWDPPPDPGGGAGDGGTAAAADEEAGDG